MFFALRVSPPPLYSVPIPPVFPDKIGFPVDQPRCVLQGSEGGREWGSNELVPFNKSFVYPSFPQQSTGVEPVSRWFPCVSVQPIGQNEMWFECTASGTRRRGVGCWNQRQRLAKRKKRCCYCCFSLKLQILVAVLAGQWRRQKQWRDGMKGSRASLRSTNNEWTRVLRFFNIFLFPSFSIYHSNTGLSPLPIPSTTIFLYPSPSNQGNMCDRFSS